ncbi:MAG: tRNA (adenosine(37)-N6)-dimethylallyltransferase MiaA [Erysipelotrichaceae bacterium]
MDKVIVIVGPTSIGKSSLSIEVAKRFNGEIVNGDSIQVYRKLNIGSAKIKPQEQQGIQHYLLDYLDVDENYNVARFQKDARSAIQEIIKKGKTPIVVGGTGLYIKALLYDYNFVEQKEVNDRKYDEYTNQQLYEMLQSRDYQSSLKIHPNNRKRIIRALLIADGGQTKSQQEESQKHELIYDTLLLDLTVDREILRERIDKRVDLMIEEGLVNEIEQLFSDYSIDSHCFQAIGYKEMIPYYLKQKDLLQCIQEIKTHTKQFAKRQYTWFKNQMDVQWFDILDENFPQNVMNIIERFINDEQV